MKNYIIPSFIIVQADSLEDAMKVMPTCQLLKANSVLIVDKKLPTVYTEIDMSWEYPDSMTSIPEFRTYFRHA